MAQARPFRFGVQSYSADSSEQWRSIARRAESLGYSTLTIHDHIGDQLAPMPALAIAADATTDLRIGTLVLDNDFRHPVVLANEVATLDVLSGGRFEWGMGAGWLPQDYERSGIEFEGPGTRVARLDEAITVMKALFSDGSAAFSGEHYQVGDIDGRRTPVQRPHPPLLVGGQGRRMLALAARRADIVSVGPSITTRSLFGEPPQHSVVEAVDQQMSWIREAAADRFDGLEINMVALPLAVNSDRAAVVERVAQQMETAPDEVLASPHMLVGSVDEIADELLRHRDRWGVSYWVVPPHGLEPFAPVVARLAGT